ncbi:hypothetical protein C240_2301 [Enterococcus sp. 5H]|nr:hypothetical protein [Enterococcus sp. 5H]
MIVYISAQSAKIIKLIAIHYSILFQLIHPFFTYQQLVHNTKKE